MAEGGGGMAEDSCSAYCAGACTTGVGALGDNSGVCGRRVCGTECSLRGAMSSRGKACHTGSIPPEILVNKSGVANSLVSGRLPGTAKDFFLTTAEAAGFALASIPIVVALDW